MHCCWRYSTVAEELRSRVTKDTNTVNGSTLMSESCWAALLLLDGDEVLLKAVLLEVVVLVPLVLCLEVEVDDSSTQPMPPAM